MRYNGYAGFEQVRKSYLAFILLCVIFLLMGWCYGLKTKRDQAQRRMVDLENAIMQLKVDVLVVEADLVTLQSPYRWRLISQELGLKPIQTQQWVQPSTFDQLVPVQKSSRPQ